MSTTKVVTISDVKNLLQKIGIGKFLQDYTKYLSEDFANWMLFQKNTRVAFYQNQGVMELMPICGSKMFSYKYVNGHPNNPKKNKLTVTGNGLLADTITGEPIMISEMTLLTALRTGATSNLVSTYLANSNTTEFGIIGCGSQSEFQVLAHLNNFNLKKIYYFDIDNRAMEKFATNLKNLNLQLIACKNQEEVVKNSQIITTCTAFFGRQEVIINDWIQKGQHINAIGGDSVEKTELDVKILEKANKIVVEYYKQTKKEGEIQNLEDSKNKIYGEIWELVTKIKKGRENSQEITIFDSVGFALEDYSMLRYVNDLTEEHQFYQKLDLVPDLSDPKNLFSLL